MTASFLGEDYLEIRDLTVDFDGFKAIDGVDVTLLQGRLPSPGWCTERARRSSATRTCSP